MSAVIFNTALQEIGKRMHNCYKGTVILQNTFTQQLYPFHLNITILCFNATYKILIPHIIFKAFYLFFFLSQQS